MERHTSEILGLLHVRQYKVIHVRQYKVLHVRQYKVAGLH